MSHDLTQRNIYEILCNLVSVNFRGVFKMSQAQSHIPYVQLGPIAQITRQVTPNVYVEDQYSKIPVYRGSSHGFVTTSEGVVMIDTPMMPTDAMRWKFEIERIRNEKKIGDIRYIINTDSHHDHTTGNSMFSPPGVVVSTQGIKENFPNVPMELTKRQISEIDPGDLFMLSLYRPSPPTITFSEKLTLYVGDHTFQCYHMPGHTPQHGGVYVPEERVFFAGDNFTYKSQPNLRFSMPLEWVESLKFIESLNVDWVVGGHSEFGPKSAVAEFRQFLQTAIDQVRDAIKKGWTKEETVEKLEFESLTGPAVHPGRGTQRGNVARFYDVLSTEKK